MGRQRVSPPRSVLLLSDEASHFHFAAGDTEKSEATAAAPRKQKARHQQQLATAFRCPSCRRADSVECRIDFKGKVAEASCWACEARFSTAAHALTEPVDVYGEWVDERHRGAKDGVDRDGDVTMC
ncbi:hypothetical protein EJB05_46018, partial [Eragrostis curvula]